MSRLPSWSMPALSMLVAFLLAPTTLHATDLEITKEAFSDTVKVGDTFSFKITVKNTSELGGGPFASPNTTVLDDLPAGLVLISATPTQGSCFQQAGEDGLVDVVCELGELPPNATVTITIEVQAAEEGTVRNSASVQGDLFDPDEGNNEDFVDVIVEAEGGLTFLVHKDSRCADGGFVNCAPEPIYASKSYAYRLIAQSLSFVSGLTLEDVLPAVLNIQVVQIEVLGGVAECRIEDVATLSTKRVVCDFDDHVVVLVTIYPQPTQLFDEVCNTAVLKKDGTVLAEDAECVPVVERLVPPEEARAKAEEIAACPPEAGPDCVVPFQTLSHLLAPGTELCSTDVEDDACRTLDAAQYATYWDRAISAYFAHEFGFALIPAYTDQPSTPDAEIFEGSVLPPEIAESDAEGNETITPLIDLPVISDPGPEEELFPTLDIDDSTPPAKPRVCALIVVGYHQNEKERLSLGGSASLMQTYLTKMRTGPRLPAGNVEVLTNPTRTQVLQKLTALKGMCDQFYFYYVGHGDASGVFLRKDNPPQKGKKFERLSYEDLAKGIYEVEAAENTVVLDNCNSGAAIPKFKADAGFKKRNLTLMTSTSAKNLGYQAFKTNVPGVLISMYTGGLTICARDPRADKNGDEKISLKESHTWLRRVNPRLLKFRNKQGGIDVFGINEKQDPQLLENKVQTSDGTKTSFAFPESGVVVSIGAGKRGAAIDAVRVEEVLPRGGVMPEDDDLMELASGRHRMVEIIESGATGFVVDVSFRMDAILDSVTTTGLPGLASRTGDTGIWTPYAGSVWNPEDSTVTLTGVTSSLDWAFALTTGASAVAIDDDGPGVPSNFALSGTYPNPFNTSTTLRFDLPESADVHVEVVDLLGREVLTLAPGRMAAGAGRTLTVQGSALSSGVYLYRLTAAGATRTRIASGRFLVMK